MQRFFPVLARVCLFAGFFFAVLEVVYGYFFRVWYETYDGIVRGYNAMTYPTKLGEMVLFAFLALLFPLLSIALSLAQGGERSSDG